METLIMVFHRYADTEGSKASLSRKELKLLMEKELSSFLKVHISIYHPRRDIFKHWPGPCNDFMLWKDSNAQKNHEWL